MINVLFIRKTRDELKQYIQDSLKGTKGINLVFPDTSDEAILTEHAIDADIIIGWRPTPGLLRSANRLKLFINPGVGVNQHIEIFRELNKSRRIILANGHGNTYFTAQHAVALLLALTNKIIPHHNWMEAGKWRTGDAEAKSIPLRNRRIGLLGYGAVNSKVHRFLFGFDVEFAVLRMNWNAAEENLPTPVKKYTEGEMTSFLEHVDILINALPKTTLTTGLIGTDELNLLGRNSMLVNVGRGDTIDEASLYRVLKDRTIAGAALDVWYDYTPEPDGRGRKFPSRFPFYELDNVVLSPHRGYSPFDDLGRWDEVIENIRRMATGETDFLNMVDLEREY